ncbi:MAG TPA: aminoacyl-tRNA hydrolase, partial [Patescibacteria group bacterium]|nr:aminoacyl-tRNA hydrolase [Patescibacteria group bacterium]
RHNIGFLLIDALARELGASWKNQKTFSGKVAETSLDGEKILLLKPETFMNLSGKSVAATASFWHFSPQKMLVVHDDADLPFGTLRFRVSGSSAGHRGMTSILSSLETQEIPRLRVGIGRPENPTIPLEAWVLGTWDPEEIARLPDVTNEVLSLLKIKIKEPGVG